MKQEQKERVETALVNFIVKTAENEKAAPEAIAVLPNAVSSLIELDKSTLLC